MRFFVFFLSLMVSLNHVFVLAADEKTFTKAQESAETKQSTEGDETLAPGELKDPLEPFNRLMFGLNNHLDGAIFAPVAQLYKDITPKPIGDGVTNFMNNLWFPINFANFILQGRMENAGKSFFRFIINTTLGIGGFFDPATEFGLEKEDTGFGDTLGSWGMEPGPYLMLPILGPSTFRGTIGKAADYFGHPLFLWTNNKKVYHRRNKHCQWYNWYVGKQALEFVNTRANYLEKLRALEAESLDYYLAIKSLHGQEIQSNQDKITKDRAKIMADGAV